LDRLPGTNEGKLHLAKSLAKGCFHPEDSSEQHEAQAALDELTGFEIRTLASCLYKHGWGADNPRQRPGFGVPPYGPHRGVEAMNDARKLLDMGALRIARETGAEIVQQGNQLVSLEDVRQSRAGMVPDSYWDLFRPQPDQREYMD
jgi:hypothetical protein